MKIAFDAKRAFRNSSGLGNYSRRTIQHLCSFFPDNNYLLFTPDQQSLEPEFPPLNTEIILPDTIITNTFKSYWRSYTTGRLIKTLKPDIYHGLSNELPMNIHKSGIKSVVTIHDLIFLRFPEFYHLPDRQIYYKKFLYACRNADLVIAASKQTRKDIIDFLHIDPNKIVVVYQSGNSLFSKKLSPENLNAIKKEYALPGEYIFYVGTIEKRKNLLQLIKARDTLKHPIPLVIVGRPEKRYFKQITDYLRTHQSKNIFFLKNVPSAHLPALYQLASLFAYPSSFEGFGIPVLEALQSGTPVIAGKGHCLEETGGPDSIYIDPGNIEIFSEKIDSILNDSELCSIMSEKGKMYSENFSPERTTKHLMDTYEKILG